MRSLRRSHWVAFTTAAVVLVVLALGGYLRGWDWTGFKGNTLWDWLHLLVLPVTLAFLPLWMQTRTRESR
jgi:ABC-type glycerol-3-phosphate transport system permease component